MSLPPPDFLAFPWLIYAPGLASRFRIPLTPYSFILARRHVCLHIYKFSYPRMPEDGQFNACYVRQISFCSSNLWVCTWNSIHKFNLSSGNCWTMQILYSRLASVTWPPIKTIGGEGCAFSRNLECIILLTLRLLDAAKKTHDCKQDWGDEENLYLAIETRILAPTHQPCFK